MRLEDCETECSFLWRPEFSEVTPKLRVTYFVHRMGVTKFDDENEFGHLQTTRYVIGTRRRI